MSDFPVRSPAAKVGGIVYFGRMIDKIRVHAEGKLPPEYQANLGKRLRRQLRHLSAGRLPANWSTASEQGGSDEDILRWCFDRGLPTCRRRNPGLE